MLTFEQMVVRLILAMALGALIGLERELVGKEAGIRTTMVMAAGAAIFTMISISLPYIISSPENLDNVIARNSGFLGVIAGIVTGVGFLGAGIILKTNEHVRGLTTAALVWTASSIGALAGLGLTKIALVSTFFISGTLYLLRKADLYKRIRPDKMESE